MKVYLSGPITNHVNARGTFREAAKAAELQGHEAVNPFEVGPYPNCSCPDYPDHAWACYMRADLAAMLRCDAIMMLPGWEESHGARLELATAAAVGLQVWMNVMEIVVVD